MIQDPSEPQTSIYPPSHSHHYESFSLFNSTIPPPSENTHLIDGNNSTQLERDQIFNAKNRRIEYFFLFGGVFLGIFIGPLGLCFIFCILHTSVRAKTFFVGWVIGCIGFFVICFFNIVHFF